jgi:hypothetical protein
VSAASGATAPLRVPLFVDAHVHLHPIFDLAVFVTSAARNVASAARALGVAEGDAIGVLLLSEGANEGAFARLRSAVGLAAAWTVEPTLESESLRVREGGRLRLIVVAGRQIVTRERVEVLCLLSGGNVSDGMPLDATIDAARAANGIPVLPWGFGKWTMRRGALVASVLRSRPRDVFLGDNGGRLAAAPEPRLFAEGRRRGVPVLPGSDPLPFRREQARAGAFGFLADLRLDEERPAEALRGWLRALREPPPRYGMLETLGRFCRNQARMQWRKRAPRG